MTAEHVAKAVDQLLAQPSADAAVELLRAVEGATEAERRLALDRLDNHLRAEPEGRVRPIVDATIALRRAGLAS